MTLSLPQTSASFTGNKLKRKMSQETSKQSHFLRTEITNTPNSKVYGQSRVAETFAQFHAVSLCRALTLPEGKRPARKKDKGEREEEEGGLGIRSVGRVLSPLQETLTLILSTNRVWWRTPWNLALRRCRQEDEFRIVLSYIQPHSKFKANMGCVRPC